MNNRDAAPPPPPPPHIHRSSPAGSGECILGWAVCRYTPVFTPTMLAICENLRGFAHSRPPIVLFMLCLGVCAIVLLTLAYIVKVNDIQNPDKQDWNMFLDGFKDVQFCMMYDNTENITVNTDGEQKMKDVVSKLHSHLGGDNSALPTTAPSTSSNPDDLVSVSVRVLVEVVPTVEFVSIPHNVTHISTSMKGHQIGLEGYKGATTMNMTMLLPYQWNSTVCTADKCPTVPILTCVNFHAPAKLFPQSTKPDACMVDASGVEYHTTMVGMKKSASSSVACQSRPLVTMSHKVDQTLRIMLTLQDRSAINLHLMHTSYFLFVMVVTMLCYALIRGPPTANKKLPAKLSEKELLKRLTF